MKIPLFFPVKSGSILAPSNFLSREEVRSKRCPGEYVTSHQRNQLHKFSIMVLVLWMRDCGFNPSHSPHPGTPFVRWQVKLWSLLMCTQIPDVEVRACLFASSTLTTGIRTQKNPELLLQCLRYNLFTGPWKCWSGGGSPGKSCSLVPLAVGIRRLSRKWKTAKKTEIIIFFHLFF